MASLQQLEASLINAHKAGDSDAARKLAAAIVDARKDPANQIPGSQVPGATATAPEATLAEKAVGTGEAALATVTGATGGAVGMAAGTVAGIAREAIDGQLGTPEAAKRVEQTAANAAQALTYAPRTQSGQEQAEAVAGAAQALIPAAPLAAQMAPAAAAMRPAAQATSAARSALQQAVRARVEEAVARRQAAKGAPEPTPGTMGSVGAAGTDMATLRRTNAQDLPVPIELTKGQAERRHTDVQFEREMAKLPKGERLRERYNQQNDAMLKNFDAWVDQTEAQAGDLRGVADSVTAALTKRAARDKAEIRVAYKAADKSDEARAVVDPANAVSIGEGDTALTSSPIEFLNSKPSGLATTALADHARQYAVKMGIAEIEDGQLVPRPSTIKAMEAWRREINAATNRADEVQLRDATILKGLIDAQTEPVAGPLYRQARSLRTRYGENYQNIAVVRDLMGTRKGSTDAKVAAEDVFRRSILTSKMDEVRQVRRILQTGGDDGKQAWRELQGATMRHIRDEATKNVARDELGNPIVSAAGLDKTITQLDRSGKLDFIFGRKGAEQLRAVNDLAKDVYTTPPGSVNHSNTASVLATYLSYLADFGGFVGGIPVPLATGLRLLISHVKDKKIQKRINEALGITPEPKAVKRPTSVIPSKSSPQRVPESRTVH